jgi:hypothetical protein
MTIIPRTPFAPETMEDPLLLTQHLFGETMTALETMPSNRMTSIVKTKLEEGYLWLLAAGAQPK